MRTLLIWAVLGVLLADCSSRGQVTITATRTELRFHFHHADALRSVEEVAPYDQSGAAPLGEFLAPLKDVSVLRFDGERDRIYSGFLVRHNGEPQGGFHFAQVGPEISNYHDPYPHTRSKKGLQVQMIDDAIALGVQHAAFNFDFGAALKPNPSPGDLTWRMDGADFWFDPRYITGIDNEVKAMSQTGATVTLILVNWVHPGTAADAILRHPHYDPACPGHVSAFNTQTPEGLAWFKATVEFLASRYSQTGFPHGRVVNYIVGNEVNSHWYWANMGHVSMEDFARDYCRAVRICDTAVRKFSASARVFISLEHDWNIRYSELDATQAFPARSFLDCFNRLTKEGGDFDWNVAYHPYPENLLDCRTWLDKDATPNDDSPFLTFRNIQVLPHYLAHKQLRYRGQPRHIILSEQGFHSTPDAAGEKLQAAAYCYAWRKIVNLKGVDAFILHRQVDFKGEGVNLGLWRRDPSSPLPSAPLSRKPIYEVFRAADTPQWSQAFAFALPVLGLTSWSEIK